MEDYIVIDSYELVKRTTHDGFGFNQIPVTHYPYVRLLVTKNIHDELVRKGVENYRCAFDVEMERIVKDFLESYGVEKYKIIGFDKCKDIRGDDWENNGYYVTIKVDIEEE